MASSEPYERIEAEEMARISARALLAERRRAMSAEPREAMSREDVPSLDVETAMEATHGGIVAGALALAVSAFLVIAGAWLAWHTGLMGGL